jgi:hypothetical protein
VAKISIDGKEYDTDQLSDELKGNLAAMQFTDAEIQRLQAKLAAMQTARAAYARAVQEGLNSPASAAAPVVAPKVDLSGDTIQFNQSL